VILMSLALLLGVEIDATSLGRKKGRDWELILSGRTKGLPDGAIMTMRFARMENRVRWKDRAILTAPGEGTWVRKVYVERNSFAHTETFHSAAEVSLEFGFFPEDQEMPDLRAKMGLDYRPYQVTKRFRVGRSAEIAAQLHQDYERVLEQTEEAGRILKTVTAEASTEELHQSKKELDKLLRKVREEPTLLAGAAGTLETILMDVYGSIGTLSKSGGGNGEEHGAATTSALTGSSVTVETIPGILDGIREIAARETALILFREAETVRVEASTILASKPDRTTWSRLKPALEKDFNVVRNVWRESKIRIEGMTEYLDRMEAYLLGVIRAMESAAPEPEPPEKASSEELEHRLRNAN